MAPLLRRTLARRGHTPVLTHKAAHRQKVSVAAAICRSPMTGHLRLFWESFPDSYIDADSYAAFIEDMLQEIKGPLLLLQDQAPLHHGEDLGELLQNQPRLWIEEFPTYAPELNPPEFLWKHLKAEELANFAPQNLQELTQTLHQKLAETSRDQNRLQSFLDSSELEW
jgi:putative transposase